MAARFPEISGEEMQKPAEKAVNKNTVKTTINYGADVVLFQQAATKHCLTAPYLNQFVVSLHRCSDSKNRDLKILSLNYFSCLPSMV